MKVPKHPTLIRRMLNARVKRLCAAGPVLAASLVRIAKTCGKAYCRCLRGQKHVGHYLTFKVKAKTRTVYVPQELLEDVSSWIAEHRRIRQLDKEISLLCLALIRSHVRARRRAAGRS